jgi:hypothetical protein
MLRRALLALVYAVSLSAHGAAASGSMLEVIADAT